MTDNSKETWKPIKGYEGFYSVSNFGRVRNNRNNKLLKLNNNGKGYLFVHLRKNKFNKSCYVHRLVLLNFIPNPDSKPECNHKDGNKLNNHMDNLEWNTRRENVHHAIKTGLSKGTCHENNDYQVNAWANYQYRTIMKKNQYGW